MLVAENPHDIQRLVQIPRWKRNSAATSDSDSDMLRSKDKGKQAAISNSDNQDASSADLDGDDDRASKGQSSSNDNSTRDGTEEGDSDEYEYVDRDVWLYEHLRCVHTASVSMPSKAAVRLTLCTTSHLRTGDSL